MKQILYYFFHLSKGFRKEIIRLISVGAIEVALSLIIVWFSKRVIDTATHSREGALLPPLLLLGGCFLLSIICRTFLSRWSVLLQTRLQNTLLHRYFSTLLHAEWKPAQAFHSGDIMSRMHTDINDVVNTFVTAIPQVILMLLSLCGAFYFLYTMEPILAGVIVGMIPFILLLSKAYFKKMRKLSTEIKQSSSHIKQFFQESIQRSEIVKALRFENLLLRQLDNRQSDYIGKVRQQNTFSIFSNLVLSIGFLSGYLVAFTWGVYSLQSGKISFGTMTAFLQLVSMIQSPALGLVHTIPGFITAYTSAERLKEINSLPEETQEASLRPIDCTKLQLQQVTFSYTPEKPVLTDINMEFRSGEITALVGHNGCGKTTLLRLLLALVSPSQGHITLTDSQGHIHTIGKQTRINFSYVPQGNYLFSGTVRDNLKAAAPLATDAELLQVLKSVSADFILQTKEQLDLKLREGGEGLSGGETQRLAIARALLCPGKILLLDEITSSLDEQAEREILALLKNNVKDRIIILVSHKRQVVELCDKVYSLE
ncbi:ABC transporter ATP-binding protein [Parabacteroides sp.]|uniref:ABC transporter ATP-binding protein n=1 Tax=Parabacteroides sp. TaxID=1869337 RepID=UPI003080E4B8